MNATAWDGLQAAVDAPTPATVKLFLMLTVLSFGSAVLLCMTSFTRMVIVLSLLRQALGTPQLPPNQVLIGLALFLSFFVMGPTVDRIHVHAWTPWVEETISSEEAAQRASAAIKTFMLSQTSDEDLRLFYTLSNRPRPTRGEDIPLSVVVPAFMVGEVSTAFRMGLHILVPMLLMDLLVSSILLSLGMMMVPPAMVALPLKLGVFVLADGWRLVVTGLVKSFGGGV